MTVSLTQLSRLGTATNLPNGSTYDLLLVATPQGYPVGPVVFYMGNEPKKITGIQKVAQMFLKTLLTTKGSDVINYNLGTNFPNLTVGANQTADDQTFLADVATTINDAAAQTKNFFSSNLGDIASQLDNATIQGMTTQGGALTMYVQLTTVAGTTAAIAIPFPQLDLALAGV